MGTLMDSAVLVEPFPFQSHSGLLTYLFLLEHVQRPFLADSLNKKTPLLLRPISTLNLSFHHPSKTLSVFFLCLCEVRITEHSLKAH